VTATAHSPLLQRLAGYAALTESRRLLAITPLAKELNIPSGITAAQRDRNDVVKFEPLLGLALGALATVPAPNLPPHLRRNQSGRLRAVGRRRYAAQGGALALKNALYQRQPLIVVQGNSRGPKPTLAVGELDRCA